MVNDRAASNENETNRIQSHKDSIHPPSLSLMCVIFILPIIQNEYLQIVDPHLINNFS